MVLSRRATKALVLIDGFLNPFLQPITVQQTLGGTDYAILEYFPLASNRESSLQDATFNVLTNATCQVILTHDSPTLYRRIHYGRIVAQQVAYDSKGERIQYVSRLENYMVSQPPAVFHQMGAMGPKLKGRLGEADAMVMNPVIDGVVVPNFHKAVGINADPNSYERAWQLSAFIDAEVGYWTLPFAVNWLCITLGATSEIDFPNLTELQAFFPPDESLIRNFRITPGRHLFEILADLLIPLGYSWYVDVSNPDVPPRLVFVDRLIGDNVPLVLKLQRYNEKLNTDQSNTDSLSLKYDVVDRSASHVVVYGDYPEVESTFKLIPGWREEDDDYETHKLRADSDEVKADPLLYRVWRTWVLNENGDYIGWRDGITAAASMPNRPDGTPLCTLTRRRKFLPTISLDPETGEPIGEFDGVNVQWRIKDATGEFGDWREWQELGEDIRCLEAECGIEIVDPAKPSRLKELCKNDPSNLEVRVTATIRGDVRIRAESIEPTAFTVRPNPFHVDAADTFRFRKLNTGSRYYSDKDKKAAEVDDTTLLQEYADHLLQSWRRAVCSGEAKLFGLDFNESFIGRPVTGIQTRGFDMNIAPPAAIFSFPIVSAVTYSINEQSVQLSLDTFFTS